MSNDLTTAASKIAKSWRRNSVINPFNAFIKPEPRSEALEQSNTAQILLEGLFGCSNNNTGIGSSLLYTRPTVTVKDNITTSNSATTCASAFLKDYTSPLEASVVRRLGENGYATKEKTNMDEFGMGSHSTHSYFGYVSNKDPVTHRSAGGSSGGSAMAVAMRERDFALGTDTGGSVRLPAAYTGVVGFKPSYGRISRLGVIPYANSLDTVGIFSSNCSQSLLQFLAHLSSHDSGDPTSVTDTSRQRIQHKQFSGSRRWKRTKQLRIGVPTEYNIEELQPIVRNAWSSILKRFQRMGHLVIPVSLPSTKHALSAYYVLAAAEASSNLAKYDGVRFGTFDSEGNRNETVLYDTVRGKGFGDEVKRRILLGSYSLSSEAIDNYFIQAQKVRRLVQRDFDRVFLTPNPLHSPKQFDLSDLEDSVELQDKLGPAQVDVLICPTAPTLPPLLDEVNNQSPVESYMNDVFTVPASLAGLPAVSVPFDVAPSHDNVPFAGIQVIGQYWEDEMVLRVGGMIKRKRTYGAR